MQKREPKNTDLYDNNPTEPYLQEPAKSTLTEIDDFLPRLARGRIILISIAVALLILSIFLFLRPTQNKDTDKSTSKVMEVKSSAEAHNLDEDINLKNASDQHPKSLIRSKTTKTPIPLENQNVRQTTKEQQNIITDDEPHYSKEPQKEINTDEKLNDLKEPNF